MLGRHLFTKVRAGSEQACGVTTTNQAWCWGYNGDGELGDGSFTNHTTPHLVAGGLALNQVSSGAFHTCARTTAVWAIAGEETQRATGQRGDEPGSTTPVAVN